MVYDRVINNYYRFPNEKIISNLIKEREKLSKIKNRTQDIILIRNLRKTVTYDKFFKEF